MYSPFVSPVADVARLRLLLCNVILAAYGAGAPFDRVAVDRFIAMIQIGEVR